MGFDETENRKPQRKMRATKRVSLKRLILKD